MHESLLICNVEAVIFEPRLRRAVIEMDPEMMLISRGQQRVLAPC